MKAVLDIVMNRRGTRPDTLDGNQMVAQACTQIWAIHHSKILTYGRGLYLFEVRHAHATSLYLFEVRHYTEVGI